MNKSPRIKLLLITFALLLITFAGNIRSQTLPKPAHIVVVILENHGYTQIAGSTAAPYINSLVNDSATAVFTQSYALSHPSQPNYIMLFSGSNQGVTTDNVPTGLPFTTLNLGASLVQKGYTFTGYSEDLPSVGYTGATSGAYARKHSPWINWQGTSTNGIATTSNQPLTAFPTDFNTLPTVSFVIPNLTNDMHDGSDPARITLGDTWIKNHLQNYITWAKSNNSLFIFTFDEDNNLLANRILTFITGAHVKKGSYATTIDHYSILRMLDDMYSLPYSGAAATATSINYCWNTTAPTTTNVAISAGWNILSAPLNSTNPLVSNVFSGANSSAYGYNNGYEIFDTMKVGKAFWLRYAAATTVPMTGTPYTTTSIPLVQGWNLVGGQLGDITVANIVTTPPGIINSMFYGFSNGYTTPAILKSGEGYWVRASTAGTMSTIVVK